MKKKILIVGGSSGLGVELAKFFINRSYDLHILGRKLPKKYEKKSTFYKVDIFNKLQFNQVLSKLNKKYFDIIIHNIGGSLGIKKNNSQLEDYKKLWFFNLGYAIKINNIFISKMKKKKWGRIIHISSATAYNLSGGGPYSSAKSALNTYVKSLAKEYGKDNVIISSICPGPINLKNRFLSQEEDNNTKFWKTFSKQHLPMKRLLKVKEILPVVELLSSEKASYCSGAIWNLDGLQK